MDKEESYTCETCNIIYKNWELNRNSLNPLSALTSILDLFIINI